MRIQTMSVVVGTTACNAKCPFCVSKTTVKHELPTEINIRDFYKCCSCAEKSGAMTILFTGKGEPTLYPREITDYLYALKDSKFRESFPFIELQTNGIEMASKKMDTYLREWYRLGMTTICLSVVHYMSERNKEIYAPDSEYFFLEKLIDKLHSIGFRVRLSVMLLNNYISNNYMLYGLINYCAQHKVDQCTIRPIASSTNSQNKEISDWIKEHTLSKEQLDSLVKYVEENGTLLLNLAHGAKVYDFRGQNLCLSNCLTESTNVDDIRQIIYYPSGDIYYSWNYNGARLM